MIGLPFAEWGEAGMRTLIAGVILMVGTGGVLASEQYWNTGNILYNICESNNVPACTTYIQGTLDGVAWWLDLTSSPQWKSMPNTPTLPRLYCIPLTVTANQITDVVKKYLNDHPEQRHYSAVSLILDSMTNAFPCP